MLHIFVSFSSYACKFSPRAGLSQSKVSLLEDSIEMTVAAAQRARVAVAQDKVTFK